MSLAPGELVLTPFSPGAKIGHVVDSLTLCWDWIGSVHPCGYGKVQRRGRGFAPQQAHRVMFERHRGPIPVGLQLDHLCRNRRCVNPWHLQPVTAAENLQRGCRIRLSPPIVKAMRSEYRRGVVTHKILSRRYGVSLSAVAHAVNRRKWVNI